MGFTRAQATAIVTEIDVLYAHSNVMGKKKTNVLHNFRASLLAALQKTDEPVNEGGTT